MRRLAIVLLTALAATVLSPGRAAAGAPEPCSERNLLAGLQPSWWQSVFRSDMVTDGVAARDGDPGMGQRSAVLGPRDAVLEYDFGALHRVGAALLQADGDDEYQIEGSADRRAWTEIATAPPQAGEGLRSRVLRGLDAEVRFVRIRAAGGDHSYAVSELQLFCRPPAALPIRVRAAGAVPASIDVVRTQAWQKLLLLPLAAVALILMRARRRPSLAVAASVTATVLSAAFVAATGAVLWPVVLCAAVLAVAVTLVARTRTQSPQAAEATATPACARAVGKWCAPLLVAVAVMAYTNFGRFGGYWSVHYHDVLHYMLGAKYAPELRYDGLYACLLEAEQQEQRWPGQTPRTVRDLSTNQIVSSAELLASGLCRDRFTADRWREFRQDAAFFMGQLAPGAWVAVLGDHGYNATPAWTWLFRPLFRAHVASVPFLQALTHVDEVAYAALVLLACWAWGVELGATAALLFAFGFPWVYLWTGGAVGRSVWLLALVAGLALGARRRFVAAGVALGASAALQLFPGLMLAGPAIRALRRSSGDSASGMRRLMLAAVVTAGALVCLSLSVAGPDLWLSFVRNTIKHAATASVNRVGPGVIASSLGLPAGAGWALSACFLAVWTRAVQRAGEAARVLSLSLLVPVFALPLSSYYLAFTVGLVPLLSTPARLGAAFATLLAVPQLVALATAGGSTQAAYALISTSIIGFGGVLCVLDPTSARGSAPPDDGHQS